jgi:Ca2+-binding RTX toxin-like protein
LIGGNGNDRIETGAGNDFSVSGQAGDDTLIGATGNEQLYGGDGNDRINAGNGNDLLYGEAGNDTLNAGAGDDFLDGGTGTDVFVIGKKSGADRIVGFDADAAGGQDLLDLNAFNFPNFASMLASGVTITTVGADTVINFTQAGSQVILIGVASVAINATDFLF